MSKYILFLFVFVLIASCSNAQNDLAVIMPPGKSIYIP